MTLDLTGHLEKDRLLLTERAGELGHQLAELPSRSERDEGQQRLADEIVDGGTQAREAFMSVHAAAVYDELTDGFTRELRAQELSDAASMVFPGLTPTPADIADERQLLQKHKDGLELAQGVFLAHIFDDARAGFHLIHSMSLPTKQAQDLLEEFRREDRIDLGTCYLERDGQIGYLTINNQQYLNAEDDEHTLALEIATDLVLLDDRIAVGVLRGARSEHPKYLGRRVFGSGVNLTKLYHGQIPLIELFVQHEISLVNKWYRGHPTGDGTVTTVERRHEKPWVAGVESHAIGGGCQKLLVMDQVIAQTGSYFNLPARREGFIPGAGNLRLPRFVGERLTRQGIFYNRDISVDSPEGRKVVDTVVPNERAMDDALEAAAVESTGTGPVGVSANRTQMRVGVEPIPVLQRYMANYSLHQARCMSSPAIMANLEEAWDRKRRGAVK